jgi:hypothetical protein
MQYIKYRHYAARCLNIHKDRYVLRSDITFSSGSLLFHSEPRETLLETRSLIRRVEAAAVDEFINIGVYTFIPHTTREVSRPLIVTRYT